MRRNIVYNFVLAFFTVLAFICLFVKSDECMQGVKDGIMLCVNSIIPSLFPFMIVSRFIVNSGLGDFFGRFSGKATQKLFKLPGICSFVIIMSMIGGFPVGAKMTCDLLESGKISENEAQRLNLFCINAGPAFVIGTVGEIFAKSRQLGVLLFFCSITASFLMGIMSRALCDGERKEEYVFAFGSVPNPVSAFTDSIADASGSMFAICSWVIIFNAVINCILSSGNSICTTALCALLEVTSGIEQSCGVLPIPVLASILSFGGFSVHCQIFSYVKKSGLNFKLFYASRIICAVLSGVICYIALRIFPFEIEVFASESTLTASAYSVSLPSAVALIVMCCSLIFELDTSRKIC